MMRQSHKQNDDYMERMYRAYEAMGIDIEGSSKRKNTTDSSLKPSKEKLQGAMFSIPETETVKKWRVSPKDPRGILFKASDRPLMCLSVYDKNEAVVGSSDHALYTFDPSTGRRKRKLYTKRHGHREWVTCVTYTSSGEILSGMCVLHSLTNSPTHSLTHSGAMDSKICVWDRKALRCDELLGHSGSISTLLSGNNSNICVSGSVHIYILSRPLSHKQFND